MIAAAFGAFHALVTAGLAFAPGGPAHAPPAFATVHVRVLTYGAVDVPTLELAEATARALLETGGIGMDWRVCGPDGCDDPRDSAQPIKLLLLPQRSTLDPRIAGQVTRDAVTHAPTVLVYMPILSERLRSIHVSATGRSNPSLSTLQIGHLVGVTLAHEVGHALGLAHARSGVMKADIGIDELIGLRAERLAFTAPDISALRLAMREHGSAPARAAQ